MNKAKELLGKKSKVIWDIDGTLLPTLEIWPTIDDAFIRHMGKVPCENLNNISQQGLVEAKGEPNYYAAHKEYIMRAYGIDGVTGEEALEIVMNLANESMRNVGYKPFAANVIKTSRQDRISQSIVTNTNDDCVDIYKNQNERIRAAANWNEFFVPNIITSNHVSEPKPSSEGILMMLDRFPQIKKSGVVLIDDSLEGIRAGLNAGIDVISITEPHWGSEVQEEIRALTPYNIDCFSELVH